MYGVFSSEVLADGLSDEQIEAIQEQHTEALVVTSEGRSQYPGMSYEQGVRDALAWVLGEREEPPMEV